MNKKIFIATNLLVLLFFAINCIGEQKWNYKIINEYKDWNVVKFTDKITAEINFQIGTRSGAPSLAIERFYSFNNWQNLLIISLDEGVFDKTKPSLRFRIDQNSFFELPMDEMEDTIASVSVSDEIINQMKKGLIFKVQINGLETREFSLKGFTKAYNYLVEINRKQAGLQKEVGTLSELQKEANILSDRLGNVWQKLIKLGFEFAELKLSRDNITNQTVADRVIETSLTIYTSFCQYQREILIIYPYIKKEEKANVARYIYKVLEGKKKNLDYAKTIFLYAYPELVRTSALYVADKIKSQIEEIDNLYNELINFYKSQQ